MITVSLLLDDDNNLFIWRGMGHNERTADYSQAACISTLQDQDDLLDQAAILPLGADDLRNEGIVIAAFPEEAIDAIFSDEETRPDPDARTLIIIYPR